MNIGIDARALIAKKVGFGYFLNNMLESMLEEDKENVYFLFSDREVVFEEKKFSNVRIVRYRDSLFFPKSFYFYYKLHQFIEQNNIQLDVFWGSMHIMPKYLSGNVLRILTIHDFTHIKYPNSTTIFNLIITKLFFKNSIIH